MAAINIGNEATEAIHELRNNPWFTRLLDDLSKIVWDRLQKSVASPPELRVEQTSHARGSFDLWDSMRVAYLGDVTSRAKPPPAPGRIRGVNQPGSTDSAA